MRLFAALVAVLAVAGCGPSRDGVDVTPADASTPESLLVRSWQASIDDSAHGYAYLYTIQLRPDHTGSISLEERLTSVPCPGAMHFAAVTVAVTWAAGGDAQTGTLRIDPNGTCTTDAGTCGGMPSTTFCGAIQSGPTFTYTRRDFNGFYEVLFSDLSGGQDLARMSTAYSPLP